MEDKPTFSYFSRSRQIWRTWFFLLTLITFRKSRNGAIGILRKLYLDNNSTTCVKHFEDRRNVWCWNNVATYNTEFVTARAEWT